MVNKWHRNCGGILRSQLPKVRTTFKKAGKCLKCGEYPVIEEDTIYEIDSDKVERLNDSNEWIIIDKSRLTEGLD